MAKRNTETRNSPFRIDAINRTNADAVSNTTGQGGSPRNLTSVWEKLNSMCFDVEWTIGTESTNAIAVTCQALDLKGRNLGRVVTGIWSIHDSDANGASYGAASADTEQLAQGTGTLIDEVTTQDSVAITSSDTDGKFIWTVTESTGADHFKIQVAIGDRVFQSPLITFA